MLVCSESNKLSIMHFLTFDLWSGVIKTAIIGVFSCASPLSINVRIPKSLFLLYVATYME